LATTFGDEVHSHVWGPSQISSLGGRKYYITFTDDHTRFTQLMPLRTKDKALCPQHSNRRYRLSNQQPRSPHRRPVPSSPILGVLCILNFSNRRLTDTQLALKRPSMSLHLAKRLFRLTELTTQVANNFFRAVPASLPVRWASHPQRFQVPLGAPARSTPPVPSAVSWRLWILGHKI
jgi:hypothetical protein